MTKPTARVLALLEILQSGGTWTVRELADRLEVDERTVRRYATAMAKLRRVLPEPLGRRLDALLAAADFTTPTTSSASHTGPAGPTGIDSAAAQSLLLFAEAAGARQPVALDYTDRHGRHSNRVVHPYGLVVHSGRWYVVAADPTDGQVRNFRLDRITAPTPRQGTFDVPAGFDASGHVVDNLADAPRRHTVSVRVHASAEQVRARIPSGLAIIEETSEPGWVRMRVTAERLDWIPALLAGLDHPFIVEEPAALRDQVRALARQLEQYAGHTDSSTRYTHPKSRTHLDRR